MNNSLSWSRFHSRHFDSSQWEEHRCCRYQWWRETSFFFCRIEKLNINIFQCNVSKLEIPVIHSPRFVANTEWMCLECSRLHASVHSLMNKEQLSLFDSFADFLKRWLTRCEASSWVPHVLIRKCLFRNIQMKCDWYNYVIYCHIQKSRVMLVCMLTELHWWEDLREVLWSPVVLFGKWLQHVTPPETVC